MTTINIDSVARITRVPINFTMKGLSRTRVEKVSSRFRDYIRALAQICRKLFTEFKFIS